MEMCSVVDPSFWSVKELQLFGCFFGHLTLKKKSLCFVLGLGWCNVRNPIPTSPPFLDQAEAAVSKTSFDPVPSNAIVL